MFSAVAAAYSLIRRRERGLGLRVSLEPYQKAHSVKMSATVRDSFSDIFIGFANKNIRPLTKSVSGLKGPSKRRL